MIKRLRIKLIAASMASLFFVLLVIGGIAGVLNYRRIVEEADRILEVLEENGGTFPKRFPEERKENPPGMSPELPYESRYFSVLLDQNGTAVLADTSKIVSIDTEEAIEYASEVWKKEKKKDSWMITDTGNVLITENIGLFSLIADDSWKISRTFYLLHSVCLVWDFYLSFF